MTSSALLLVLLSAGLHALWSISIKASRDPVAFNLLQALISGGVGLVVLAWVDLGALPRGVWIALIGTSISHGWYFFLLGRALARGELTLVYPIARSTPALLPLIAVPFLGELISWEGALGIGTVVAGMWLVSTRGALSWRALKGPGAGFAYLTLLSTVAYSLFDKEAMTRLDAVDTGPLPAAVVFYFLLCCGSLVCFLPLALPRVGRHGIGRTIREEWKAALAATAVSFVGYGLILEAYRTAPASYVVAVRQSSVIFALVLSIWLLREGPGRARSLGAVATVAGVVLIALFP